MWKHNCYRIFGSTGKRVKFFSVLFQSHMSKPKSRPWPKARRVIIDDDTKSPDREVTFFLLLPYRIVVTGSLQESRASLLCPPRPTGSERQSLPCATEGTNASNLAKDVTKENSSFEKSWKCFDSTKNPNTNNLSKKSSKRLCARSKSVNNEEKDANGQRCSWWSHSFSETIAQGVSCSRHQRCS